MLILPAIDLYNGKCVRLRQGNFNDQTIYSDSPTDIAQSFYNAGLTFLHIVDLEGAKAGRVKNWDAIKSILQIKNLRAQVGGGIRTTEDIQQLFEVGVTRVIIGSIAVQSPTLVKEWIQKFGGERIVIALDVKNGLVAYKGWQQNSDLSALAFSKQMMDLGAKQFLCTDIGRDGMLEGPNVQLYKELKTALPTIDLIASGGVSSINDIEAVKRIGCSGAIVGKAIYEGRVTLEELKRQKALNK
jgi:phosphoribosylformimino-5-aminoimidazole carboxamide ribotide isomerase